MGNTAYIPEDVIFLHILTRLPANLLLKLKNVCKSWQHQIDTREFVRLHLRQSLKTSDSNPSIILTTRGGGRRYDSYILNDLEIPCPGATKLPLPKAAAKGSRGKVELTASCNGMLLLNVIPHGYFLWNPLRPDAFRELNFGHMAHTKSYNSRWRILGFGYDEYSDDYKLILNYSNKWRISESESLIYCLGADTWKLSAIVKSNLILATRFNNSLHHVSLSSDDEVNEIVVFDLHDDVWGQMSLSDDMLNSLKFSGTYSQLSVYKGSLSVILSEYAPRDWPYYYRHKIWVMKEYGVKESWTKLFEMRNCATVHRLFFSERQGRVALVGYEARRLAWHSDRQDVIKVDEITIQEGMQADKAVEYVGSLVSVFDLGKK